MSRTTKIILGILAGLVVLCICVAVGGFLLFTRTVGRAVSINPRDAATTAHQITDYTLPAGWSEQGGMNLMGMSMAIIDMKSSDATVIIVQLPGLSQNQDLFEQQMRQSAGANLPSQVQEITTQQVTIRGQPTTLTVSEGTNSSGRAYRLVTGTFQGKNGPAFLMIAAPTNQWDQSAIDSFIHSMR